MVAKFLVYILLSLPLVGAYAMMAVGIVVVFRASKVLNLAQGAMAMAPAYVVYEAVRVGIPMGVALPVGVASGAMLGALVERWFVRPLARQGTTAQTVGTVAVYGLVVSAAAQIWGSGSLTAPRAFPEGGVRIAGSVLSWGQLGLCLVALVASGACFALFRFTGLGLALRGAAENPRAAGLMGINADRMARIAWMLGGALAALAGILLAAVTNLQPYNLSLQMLPAFVAALIGGLGSLPGAMVGAAVVGVAQGIVPAFAMVPGVRRFAVQVGMPQLVLTIVALGAMYFRGNRFSVADAGGGLTVEEERGAAHSTFDTAHPKRLSRRRRVVRYALLVALVSWPFLGVPSFLRPLDTFSLLGDAILAGQYFLAAASIVMLTGWVGQISLSQAAFVGISAFGSAIVTRKLGIGFPFSLPLGAALAAGASVLLGVVALRVRGLYLAVATLIFAWMADEYLFVVPWFAGKGGSASASSSAIGVEGTFPYFDFTERRTFYFVMLCVASAVLLALLNLRDSKTGRAFAALRGSEVAAASLGVDVVRYKLLAFGAAGAIAGLAGNLQLAHQVTVVPEQFALRSSLLFLAIAVVGGLRSLSGAVAASLLFAALSEVFFRVPALGEYLQLVSACLLALILLLYPGGLAALPGSLRRLARRLQASDSVVLRPVRQGLDGIRGAVASASALADGAMRRTAVALPTGGGLPAGEAAALAEPAVEHGHAPEPTPAPPLAPVRGAELRRRGDSDVPAPAAGVANALEASSITVRFGGLTAVEDVSLQVPVGEIVGLIGPNGAGKTTLFNAISGLNSPTSGTVTLFGEDVTALPVHERARRGLGRTFQVIQLFPELTVFENILVGTHARNRSNVLANVLLLGSALEEEVMAEEECRRIVRVLGLEEIADRPVGGLPFGTLRMVEIGRALVTGAPVIMLDEPASGLDNAETDNLSQLLLSVRAELGTSILLIEHDVRMVTSISDRMFVINRGRLLASGTPAAVQRDPAVIAAYLGEPVG